jgi:hypothetical protein
MNQPELLLIIIKKNALCNRDFPRLFHTEHVHLERRESPEMMGRMLTGSIHSVLIIQMNFSHTDDRRQRISYVEQVKGKRQYSPQWKDEYLRKKTAGLWFSCRSTVLNIFASSSVDWPDPSFVVIIRENSRFGSAIHVPLHPSQSGFDTLFTNQHIAADLKRAKDKLEPTPVL